jgi:hypothetical protein
VLPISVTNIATLTGKPLEHLPLSKAQLHIATTPGRGGGVDDTFVYHTVGNQAVCVRDLGLLQAKGTYARLPQ